MRIRNVLIATVLALMALAVPSSSLAQKAAKAFACPKCEVASMKAGKCGCGEQMVAANGRIAYVCTHCNTSSAKPGNCAKCGMKLQKSLITYACEGCKVSSAKPGDCAKCGGALHKHILPFKA